MKLMKAFFIDAVNQKVSEFQLSLSRDNLQYFLGGDNIVPCCLGEEGEYMLFLKRLNFRRKKAGYFKMAGISEELYPGNGLLFSINPDEYKSLVFEDVKIEVNSFSQFVSFFRPNQVTETDIRVKVR